MSESTTPVPAEAIEAAARAAAIHQDYDGCFVRVDEWEALTDEERSYQSDERPDSDYEDCEWWRVRAAAALAAAVPVLLAAERGRIVQVLRTSADGYRTMTRKVLLELAAQIERADHEVVCSQCGALRSEVERSQSARRPIPCEVLKTSGAVVKSWPRHRFARPRSDS